MILKIKKSMWAFFPPIQGKSKMKLVENNYIVYKTCGSSHSSIYKINYVHEQVIQKSGKQMSKNTSDKPAPLIISSSCLNKLKTQFPSLWNEVLRKLSYITKSVWQIVSILLIILLKLVCIKTQNSYVLLRQIIVPRAILTVKH